MRYSQHKNYLTWSSALQGPKEFLSVYLISFCCLSLVLISSGLAQQRDVELQVSRALLVPSLELLISLKSQGASKLSEGREAEDFFQCWFMDQKHRYDPRLSGLGNTWLFLTLVLHMVFLDGCASGLHRLLTHLVACSGSVYPQEEMG